MNTSRVFSFFGLGLLAISAFSAQAAVKLTAIQIFSTDADGQIQGVGAHRFKTTNHGGHPCIFLVRGDDLDGAIINGPGPQQNGVDLTLSAGTHTYTIYVEKENSRSWGYYTIDFHFDRSDTPQISALAAMNAASTQFFPPFAAYAGNTENLTGYPVKSPNTLVYQSGQTEVTLTAFQFSAESVFNKDRVSPNEAKSNHNLDYVGSFTLEVKAAPEISAGGVVHAASFTPKVAPGSLFSIFGSSLATSLQTANTVPLPSSLGGTTVTIGGKAAPLVFVSPEQINAQVPYEVAEGAKVPVIVTVNGVSSPAGSVTVSAAAPGIFQFGQKRAVVQNQDYSTNNADNGADANSYVVAYLSGAGQLDNPVATGNRAGRDPLSRPKGIVTATINGVPAEVAFAGMTPDFIGLFQVNLKVPSLSPGTYPLVISVNEEKSNSALITVK